MRVLHITPYFAPAFRYGGPPRSILGLCQALQRAGVEVEVVTTTADGAEALPPSPEGSDYEGIRVRYLPLAFPKRYWRVSGLAAALDRSLPGADLVHVHGLWHMIGAAAVARTRAADLPYVVSPRGMLQPAAMRRHRAAKAAAYWAVERGHLRDAMFLHATSPVERREIGAYGPPVVMIPNGVASVEVSPEAIEGLRERARIEASDEVVLCLGRLHPIKRLDLLAAAFAIVRRGRPRARLVLAGPDEDGYRRQVEPLFAPVADATRWLGPVDAGTAGALFAASRTLVQCSDSESFGMSVAEALAAGLPVVVTDNTPWAQVAQLGMGHAVAPEPRLIADAIVRILEDPADGRAMGARARAWAGDTLGWDGVGQSMREAYRQALERRRTSAT